MTLPPLVLFPFDFPTNLTPTPICHSMNGLRRPKASRGSGAQAPGAHDPARQAPLAHNPIFQATGGPQPVAAGVSAPLVHGLSTGTRDRYALLWNHQYIFFFRKSNHQ